MKQITLLLAALLLGLAAPSSAEVSFDGFLQGLYGGRLDDKNPTATEQTASETRFQLRAEHFGEGAEIFARLDFIYDGADSVQYDWELREAFTKFRLGDDIDVKAGRQILTWGTGDLIFINDVFAKDYRSFFVGRDDQYLKAPQNAIRVSYYNPLGDFTLVWTPRFEPNRLPQGRRLSYFNPFVMPGMDADGIVGEGFFFDPPLPESRFKNGEFAFRYSRRLGYFRGALYAYKGFYKNPRGAEMMSGMIVPVYPRLHVYGASIRGPLWSGILWAEGGYFDSYDDRHGDDPMMPNSSATGMIGYERQVATNLTINAQWQVDYMFDHDIYAEQQTMAGAYARDEYKHLLTSRIRKLLNSELVTVEAFVFYSPSDEDVYARLMTEYKYTDEIILAVGANIFDGNHAATEFGQFQKNDNVWAKITYGF